MSLIDQVVETVKPVESDEVRLEARLKVQETATPGDWLSLILQHHVQIEQAFAALKACTELAAFQATQQKLVVLLTGHANAEESVIYPALGRSAEKGYAQTAYSEQAEAKMQMAALELLEFRSKEYFDVLEDLRCAVSHHMYQEESKWFLKLNDGTRAVDQVRLTERYQQEFDRYVGGDSLAASAQPPLELTTRSLRSGEDQRRLD
jgi:hypothetical protein